MGGTRPVPHFLEQVDVPTPKKDLRGGRPLWLDTPRIDVRYRTRLTQETCDVAVVGAGISGALVALSLAEHGHDVVIVDRGEPCRGSTLASTAMIQFELDTPLVELADRKGAAAARRAHLRPFAPEVWMEGAPGALSRRQRARLARLAG